MIQIALTERESGLLRELLDARLVELRREISNTESPRFREMLYELDRALEHMLEQLPDGVAERR